MSTTARANKRTKGPASKVPQAVYARFDRRLRRVMVQLDANVGIFFSPKEVEELAHGTPDQFAPIEISPSGLGLHFPKLNAHLSLPALLEGVSGSERWVASQMGSRGGKSRSAAKTSAARENGKKGGRPGQKDAAAAVKQRMAPAKHTEPAGSTR